VPDLEACILRICDRQGNTRGTGFLVSERLAVTCAHVVKGCGVEPGGCVRVVFYAGGQEREAEVLPEFWRPSERDDAQPHLPLDDVAILRLLPQDEPLPQGVAPAQPGSTRACSGHAMRVLGFPPLQGGYDVAWAEGELRGVVRHPNKRPMLQMDARPICEGMSGAPVLDLTTQRVVGVVCEYLPDTPLEWATTAETLQAVYPDLRLHPPQAVQDYLAALREYCDNLPYVSLRRDVMLETVYVRQQMRPKPAPAPGTAEPETQRTSEQYSPPTAIAQAVEEHARIVVMGGAGAGKSTLLRHLVQQSATGDQPASVYLPILVSLRGLAERRGDLTTCLREQVAAELGKRLRTPLPERFLDEWGRQTGQVWLIVLDGLDEVVDTGRRRECLHELAQTAWPSQTRLLITTRPDETVTWPAEFTLFDLLPFELAQVEEFVERWFRDDAPRAQGFLDAVRSARLGGLSSTPLLLTIAATVFEETGNLSERRSTLYQQFVALLLGLWHAGRHEPEPEPVRTVHEQLREQFGPELGEDLFDYRLEILECIALALQKGRDIYQALADVLRGAPFKRDERRASRDAAMALQILASQRNGLLARHGGAYDFIHPTFREYLAACAVVRESRRDRGYDLKQVWRRAVSRWADETWHEVALFALSLLSDGGQNVTVLVSSIRRKREEGLYFAGAALAEQVKVAESLSDGIIDGLFTEARSPWESWQAFSILGELRSYPRAGDRLLALARDEEVDAEKRKHAAEVLGKLGRAAEATQVWLALAHDEKVDAWVREQAAEALGELGRADEAAQAWLALARDEKVGKWVRERAAEVLGELGRADDLLALARDEKVDEWMRVRAAKALGKLGRADEAAQAWLALARDEKVDEWMRVDAAEALGELGRADDLLALVRDEKADAWVRVRAAGVLGKLGRADKAAPICLALARDEKAEARVREHAAAVLGQLGRVDEAAPILLALARDEKVDWWLHQIAAEALGELGRADEAAQAWLALAHDEKVNEIARVSATAALGQFADGRVLPTLEQMAQEDKSERVRRAAQRAIEQIRQRIE